MRRRLFSLGLMAAVLTGCGFKLRQTGDYPFKSLYANFSVSTPLGSELRRHLLATGKIDLLTEPKDMSKADVILDILSEVRQPVVVGLNASGQVREMQLRLRVHFRLRTPSGDELIEPVEMYQQRDLSFTETAALSKEIEQAMLFREMQLDIVQQIMRRLSAVKPRHLPVAPAPAVPRP